MSEPVKAKKNATFARNAEQLARAFGFNLSPRKRKKSLAVVTGWTGQTGFPAKTAKGWVVAEVRQWVDAQNAAPVASQPALPVQDQPAPDEALFHQEADAERLKRLLDLYQDKFFFPEKYPIDGIKVWQVNFLKQHRPVLFDMEAKPAPAGAPAAPVAEAADNDLCDSYTELANRMALHYQNPDGSSRLKYDLDKQAVSDWKQGKRLDGRVPPPSRVGAKRQLSLRAWLAWFDQYFLPEWKLDSATELPGLGAVMNISRLREQDEREQIEFNKWERQKELGKYVEVALAGRLAGGQMRQLADYWRHRNETLMIEASREKLRALGGSAELITAHTDWLTAEHRRFTDEIEAKARLAAERYDDQLRAEVAARLQK